MIREASATTVRSVSLTPDAPPAEVLALAQRRAEARAARDFAESDRLRDEIADAGWVVRDGPDGFVLAPRPPYDVLPSVDALPDRSAEPDTHRCTVALLVDGWPDDVRTCVAALLEHAPEDVRVVLLENGETDAGAVVHELAGRAGRPSCTSSAPPAGRRPARRWCAGTRPRCTCRWTSRRCWRATALAAARRARGPVARGGLARRAGRRRLARVRGRRHRARSRRCSATSSPCGARRPAGAAAAQGALLPQRRHGVVVPAARGGPRPAGGRRPAGAAGPAPRLPRQRPGVPGQGVPRRPTTASCSGSAAARTCG
jgi:hypothetical protein